jgi:hypothetical protein
MFNIQNMIIHGKLLQITSQKNSFPRRPQNQEIHETSSELLIFLRIRKFLCQTWYDSFDKVVDLYFTNPKINDFYSSA